MRYAVFMFGTLISLSQFTATPSVGTAQRQASRTLAGRWTYDGSVTQGESIVANSVESALALVTPNIQRLARERIAESTWLPHRIRIRMRPDHVTVDLRGAQHRIFAGRPGTAIQVPTRHGYAELTQYVDADGALHQRFVALEGVQHHVYRPGPGQTMQLEVTLESPSLPQSVHFTLNYRR